MKLLQWRKQEKMSITLKDFKAGNFKRRNNRAEHPVLVFLKKNKRAYTINEISKTIKMKKQTVRSMMIILRKQKLVEHKAPYFAYSKH